MKKIVALMLACGFASSAFAIGIGKFKINPEVGASLGTASDSNTFLAGGYGRIWLGGNGLTIAPHFKYNYILGKDNLEGYSNIQAGGLLGYRIWRFTPYVGVSYSTFSDKVALQDTTAFNYGIYFDIPIVPLSVGIDGSYQKPKVIGDTRHSQNQIALTIGLIF